MYEFWIVLFCLLRSIVTKWFSNKKSPKSQQIQQSSSRKQLNSNQNNSQTTVTLSPIQIQLNEAKSRKHQIESTMEQYNNPSTFAKYSKMQRQLSKLSNQIQNLESDLQKQASTQTSQGQNQANSEQERSSILDQKKKQIKKIHSQIGNKDLLIKALANLGLIILCSYVQSSQISVCSSYPLYTFCNETGRTNGAWIFIFSTIIFSH